MASGKAQYVVVLIAEFAEYYGITTTQAAKYLSQYKVLELFDRQYGCLHTQSYCLQRARPLRLLPQNGRYAMITLYHGIKPCYVQPRTFTPRAPAMCTSTY